MPPRTLKLVAIRLARGAVARICDHGERFAVQVQHATPLTAALAALRLARGDLLALAARGPSMRRHSDPDGEGASGSEAPPGMPGPPTVSQVVAARGGPLLLAENFDVPYDLLRTAPDLVIARLVAAGVIEATVASPAPGGPLDRLDVTPSAVILRLFPPPAGPNGVIPASWLDVACEWALGDLADNHHVRMRILTVEFDVAVREASTIVHECGLTRAWCDVVNGSLADRIRTASLTF
jgi:hypothetical protein